MLKRFLLIFMLAGFTHPAFAAKIDQKGVERLGHVFEQFMADRKSLIEADGVTKIDYDGVAVIEPAKEYYAVTLPRTKITYPDGRHFEIGMVSINATPADKEGQWKMTIALPTPLTMTGVHGSIEVKINVGEQRAAGIWDEGLQGFSKLDALYKNIVVENYKYPYTATIPSAQMVYDFSKDDKDLWSGPGSMAFDRIAVVMPAFKLQGHVDSVHATFALDHYNAQSLKEYQQKISQITQKLADKKPGVSSSGMPVQLKDFYAPLFDLFASAGNGFSMNYTVSSVDFSWQGKDQSSPGLFKLNTASAGVDAKAFNGTTSALNLLFNYDGLEMQMAQMRAYKDLTPAKATVNVAFQNIPVRQISDLMKNTLNAGDSLSSPLAGLTLMMKVPALLSQSGAVVTLKDNSVSTKDYSVVVNGQAKADIAAVNSATAHATAVFQGLDRLIALTQERADDPAERNADRFKALAAQLKMVKSYSKVEAVKGGPSKNIIDMVMDEKGQMLINGQSLQSLVFKGLP